MSSKNLFAVLAVVAVIAVVVMAVRSLTPEDSWVCENGQWVRHGNPSSAQPSESCPGANNSQGEEPGTNQPDEPAGNELIRIDSPRPDEQIGSPFVVTGEARGNWYFEASFPVRLYDESGRLLATAIATAQGDWMTENFVPFRATLDFPAATATAAVLVLEKDNPSGLPENAAEVRVPVRLNPSQSQRMTVRAYFNNNRLDPEVSCNKVFPVERQVMVTSGVGRAALEELLKGATVGEKEQGYYSSLNDGIRLQNLTIENGVAKADFNSALDFKVGGSCRVSAIRSQIIETLKQFPSVSEVVISIDGRTEDILQP